MLSHLLLPSEHPHAGSDHRTCCNTGKTILLYMAVPSPLAPSYILLLLLPSSTLSRHLLSYSALSSRLNPLYPHFSSLTPLVSLLPVPTIKPTTREPPHWGTGDTTWDAIILSCGAMLLICMLSLMWVYVSNDFRQHSGRRKSSLLGS